MSQNIRINYLEFGAVDLHATKMFYEKAFGWTFTDYGPEYVAFSDGHIDGGFTTQTPPSKGTLVILYSDTLETSMDQVRKAGGTITQEIYSFPGGRRFHFLDPNGNELAIWSDK